MNHSHVFSHIKGTTLSDTEFDTSLKTGKLCRVRTYIMWDKVCMCGLKWESFTGYNMQCTIPSRECLDPVSASGRIWNERTQT